MFDQFFAISPEQYPGVIFTRWCKMAHCLILLHHLHVLDDPSWDPATAGERVDLFAIGDRLASILAEAGGSGRGALSATDDSMSIRFSRMIRSMCSAWRAEFQSLERRQQSGGRCRLSQSLWRAPNIDVATGIRGKLARGGMTPAPPFEMISDDVWLNEMLDMAWIDANK
jgi:hypothetical protein